MPINPNAGPTNGRTVMQEALSARVSQTRTTGSPLGGAPQTGSPLPVYDLPIGRMQDARPLDEAMLTSWRYPVIGGLYPALVDIRESANDGLASFGGLSHGPMAARLIQASLLAEQTLGANPERYEPRLLDVPALQFSALWLHGDESEHFISLMDGHPPGTAPLKMVDDIASELRVRAATRVDGRAPLALPVVLDASATPTN